MTVLFTRATAGLTLSLTASGSADNPGSASAFHIVPLNQHNSPINITYYVTQGAGTGKVSGATYFTISEVDNPRITPIWFLLDSILAGQTTVQSSLVPMTAWQLSINVSGSANYAAGMFQPGR